MAGSTYTDSVSVTSADGTTSSITVSIVGTNDAAVITPAPRQSDGEQCGTDERRHHGHQRCR
ncbi:MAG: hypothetical protein IPO38_03575 [Rhodocyclaceae bacterium]|nr:hypothetical protein [Rhodocyclaceae bacterium]